MANQTIYTVGGTVQAGGGIYIPRKADDELLGYCRASEFAFILSSRQVGKSSLMVRTARQLESENIRSVIIDLSNIGVNVSANQWYLGILNIIAKTLKLKTDIFTWWSEGTGLGPAQQMTNFFSDVLLKEVSEPVVLFFDEIDSTLSIPFITDDFFAALRAVYNARSTMPEFKRLSFVLIGVATPSNLIADDKRTPFNIGHRVDLTDFTPEEAQPLAGHLGTHTLGWVFCWTGGHPYLTQRLCAYLSKDETKITEESVAEVVKQLFEGEQGWQDNNLQFVRDMLTKRSHNLSRVLKTYKDIRTGKKIKDDERSIVKAHLKISGIVRSENGFLSLRNQIYKKVFSARWAQSNIPHNWAKVAAFSFGLLSFVLLSIFVYDFAVEVWSSQYAGDFYTSRTKSEKLKNLAGLFEIEGVLQNTDYDFRAREVFYSLNWDEQVSLFNDSYITPDDRKRYLPVIINGLYVTMANVEGQQDSSDLLIIMKDSLKNVETSESINLQNEIDFWLKARNTLTDQNALIKYNEAIQLNSNNPATLYERALIALRLERYEQALLDLDAMMGLAQNLSSETSEVDVTITPALLLATQSIGTRFPLTTTSHSVTQTFELPTALSMPTSLVQILETPLPIAQSTVVVEPTIQPNYGIREGYKSSFYSIAYIRSAVDLVLQGYNGKPDFDVVLNEKRSVLTNLINLGLIIPSTTKPPFFVASPLATSQEVVCTPNPSYVSIYSVTPQPLINIIFQAAASPVALTASPSESQIQNSRYAALQYLSNETKRWSDIETIKLDDFSEVQIVVTFISPELLQAVFLSEILKQGIFYPDFEAETQAMLNSVAARDELLFLLTVTTTNTGGLNLSPHTINIPIKQMFLTNGEDLQVAPRHDDHILDQPINSSSKSVFGYLAYPLAVVTNSECKWMLEPKYNTSIVITVPFIQVDGVNSGPYTWIIPYSSLIDADSPLDLSILMMPPGFDPTLLSPLELPPNGNIEQTNNWQGFARFVWSQVTHGNY